MTALTRIRTLMLKSPSAPGRQPFLAAASGLVCTDRRFYVVADDELHLGVFDRDLARAGRLLRLFDGELPPGKAERKNLKPDFEALTRLPAMSGYADGALLALGSGSTPDRRRGALIALDKDGELRGPVATFDLALMFDTLGELFPEPNIEGATVDGGEFRLFQRGNIASPDSFAVRFELEAVVAMLRGQGSGRIEPLGVHLLGLGTVEGIPYSVTDAATIEPGQTIVTAVAEKTANAYDDGACVGALIALLDRDMRVVRAWPLDQPLKVEGVCARRVGNRIDLALVTDADDPDIPAALYTATVVP